MVISEPSQFRWLPAKFKECCRRAAVASSWILLACLLWSGTASAQADFTLQAASLSPQAVAPGGTSSINLTIGAINGFTGTVNLSCQVTSTQTTNSTPTCAVSPPTVTPPGGATATITTTIQTTPVSYAITITGTGPSTTHTTTPQNLTVLAVTPGFTITVLNPLLPGSVPAGSGAQGKILVTPLNGYTSPQKTVGSTVVKGITLSCATITPLVSVAAPVCSFNPAQPELTGSPISSTITINTYGPTIINASTRPQNFRSLWLSVPMFALAALGAIGGGNRSRKGWGLLALFVLGGALFLLPACGNTQIRTTSINGVTPNNTYSFTVIGVDANGVVSSNATSTSGSNTTFTLTVTSPVL